MISCVYLSLCIRILLLYYTFFCCSLGCVSCIFNALVHSNTTTYHKSSAAHTIFTHKTQVAASESENRRAKAHTRFVAYISVQCLIKWKRANEREREQSIWLTNDKMNSSWTILGAQICAVQLIHISTTKYCSLSHQNQQTCLLALIFAQ